jgi:RecA-family ATPase
MTNLLGIEALAEVQKTKRGRAGGPRPVELVSAEALGTMVFPEPRWAVPGLIPEGLSILAGRPKLGKSFLALNLGVAVATGRSFLGQFAAPEGDAVYFALEDTRRRLQRRLRMMFPETLAWPAGLFLSTELPRIDQGGLAEIERILDEHPSCRFVGLDTMARIRTPKKRGADVYQEDAEFIAQLQRKALDRSIALLLVHHTRKMKTEDVLDDVAGTTGLTGSADTILVLTRARGADEAVLHCTGRDVEERELALKFDREHGSWAYIGNAEEVMMSRDRRELIEALRRLAPAKVKDLAESLGWKYDRTKKLLYRCSQDGLVREGMRQGTYVPATYDDKKDEALHEVFPEALSGPLPELRPARATYAVPDSQNRVEVVARDRPANGPATFVANL